MSDTPDQDNHPDIVSRNSRYGLWLFAVYVSLYSGFIFLAVFRPAAMAQPVIGGVNLAIVYGFALIIAAFVLAMIYTALCRGRSE